MTRLSFRRFATWVLIANLFVVVWGAFVRATGSGAGCGSNWPLCNGEVVPREASAQTLIEYTHRATSGVVLLLGLGLLVAARRTFDPGHPARSAAGWSFVFLLSEAAVGAGLVLMELVGTNESAARAVWMVIHLTNTFFLLGALTATVACSGAEPLAPRIRGSGDRGRRALGVLLGILAVGATGAVAALGDTLYPASSLREGLIQDVTATQLLVKLRVVHPGVAVLVGLVLLAYANRSRRDARHDPRRRRLANRLALLFWAQIAIGALNVVLLAPVWLQLVHLLVADLLWIVLVALVLCNLAATAEAPGPAPRSTVRSAEPSERTVAGSSPAG